jgi:hypothetical protein
MNAAAHIVAPEEIMALHDGELSADRAQAVSNHLESCVTCDQLSKQLQSTTRSLASWKLDSAPGSVTNVVLNKAKNLPSSGGLRSVVFPAPRLWTWKHWLGGLAGAASLVLLFLFAATPNLRRSRMAANEAAAIGRERAARQNQPVDFARVNQDVIHQSGAATTDGQLAKDEFEKLPRYQDVVSELTSNAEVSNGSLNGTAGKLTADQIANSGYKARVENGPMIARTVSLAVIVRDFAAVRSALDTILARHNGYSANLSVSTPQDAARSLQASLRVPAPQLTAALNELKTLGRVETETQNGDEVTQQHADLVARLKNSRETEQRLQAILVQRTGKISDVLEVEQEIARVRGEIEQMEAEQENLEHRVDFATIDLKISEEYKAQLNSPAPSVSTQIHNALVNGYRNVADTLLGLILFFAEYGPVLLLWCGFLLIPAYLVWRRWRTAAAAA